MDEIEQTSSFVDDVTDRLLSRYDSPMSSTTLTNTTLLDGVCRIELNRPDTLNAFDIGLCGALLADILSASADTEVRAIVITGAGRGFSSGADLRSDRRLLPDGNTPALGLGLRETYSPVITAIATARKPVIAAVHGPAAGFGAAVAFACDLIVAAESAYFLLAFAKVGLIPDGGTSHTLTARIGFSRAVQLAMLCEPLDARRALDWGVINDVYPDPEFGERTAEFVARLAQGPTVALAAIKRAFREAPNLGLVDQLELEAELQQAQATTNDHAEGVLAFKEKRTPRFTGT
jgi:2-(1,2-epoxy-1,2-dihydrophenyl)acetyl-CoA isomerase